MSNKIEVFRAGTRADMSGALVTISADDLAQTAAQYDKNAMEAPIVVGHPKTDSPAYGWVSGLSVDESGVLIANIEQLDPEFAEIVKAGRYKHVSASFFAPQSPSNPKPGTWYLRHVGFLGAATPAVKGLKPASFADNDGQYVFSFANADTSRDKTKGKKTMTEEEIKAKEAELKAKEAEIEAKSVKFAESAKAAEADRLKAKEAELEAREKALEAKAAEARKLENVAFAEKLVTDGKILPRDKEHVVTLMAAISDTAIVNFAENGESKQISAVDAHKKFLDALPVRIEFSEKSKDPEGAKSPGDGETPEQVAKRIASYSNKKGK